MRRRLLRSAILVLACVAAPSLGAQPLRPGSGMPTDRIRPRADTFAVFFGGRSRGAPDARMTLETRLTGVGGTPAVVRTETLWVEEQAVQVDSFVLARATLAPLALRSAGMGRNVSLDFSADRARGWTEAAHRYATKEIPLSGPVFLASSMDLVLGALPLRAGYTAELALFDAGEGEVTARVEVADVEELSLPEGRVRAWRVRVRGSGTEGTYWMQEGTQTLVRFAAADRSMQIIRARGAGERMAAR